MTRPLGYTQAVGGGGGGGAVSSVAGRTGDVVLAVADVSGAQSAMTTQSKTANFNAAAGVIYLVDTTSGVVTATLPSANVAGQKIALKWVGGTNTFTITRSGSDTIGSATTTANLSLLNEIWELTSSGTGQWNLTGGNKTLSSLDARYEALYATVSNNASFTASVNTLHLVDSSSGAVTVTLPAANVAGRKVAIKLDAGANPVTVTRSGSDTIGSAATSAQITLSGEVWVLESSGAGQWNLISGNKTLSSLDARYNPNALAVGEIVPARDRIASNTVTAASGIVYLTYFTADKTEAINTLTMSTGTVAAAATPTLCRMAAYSVAANGDLTLVASTPNDTTLFAATNTAYAKALSATWNKVAGQRYAVALLVVSASTMPNFHGTQLAAQNFLNTLTRLAPALAGRLTGQTDLPSSITAASLVGYQALFATQMS